MKRMKQINKSKRKIKESFFTLLEEVDYDHITISMICSKADISRVTFYRHFNTKEDIVTFLFENIFEEIMVLIKEKEMTGHKTELFDIFYARLLVLKKNYELINLIPTSVMELVFSIFKDSRAAYINNFRKECTNKYESDYIVGGVDYVVRRWFESGAEDDPKELAEVLCNLIL